MTLFPAGVLGLRDPSAPRPGVRAADFFFGLRFPPTGSGSAICT